VQLGFVQPATLSPTWVSASHLDWTQ